MVFMGSEYSTEEWPAASLVQSCPHTKFSFLLMARKLLLLARELKASVIFPGEENYARFHLRSWICDTAHCTEVTIQHMTGPTCPKTPLELLPYIFLELIKMLWAPHSPTGVFCLLQFVHKDPSLWVKCHSFGVLMT